MKILFLTRLYAPHVGGVEKHVQRLSEELINHGHHITILTEQFSPELPLIEKQNNIAVHRIHYQFLNSKFGLWKEISSKIKLFLAAEVIHIHDVFWWILPLLPMLLLKKVFITFHGYEGAEPPAINQIWWHRLAAWVTRGNICIGDFHHKWYGVQPTTVSYGAVDEIKNSSTKTDSIVFIGRLSVDTGILEYLQAFIFLAPETTSILHIYGDGELRSHCEQLVKTKKLAKRVIFHGFVGNASKALATAKVAYVSRYLAILEALAANTPSVAHYNNSIKEDYLRLAPFAPWISVVHSPEEIIDATLHPRLIPAEAKTWLKQQTWQKMMHDYLKLWQI